MSAFKTFINPKKFTGKERLAIVTALLLGSKFPPAFQFDMSTFGSARCFPDPKKPEKHICGTAACVAGFTEYLFNGTVNKLGETELAELLGMKEDGVDYDDYEKDDAWSNQQWRKLFYAYCVEDMESVTPLEAGRTLVRYIRTGKVYWSMRHSPVYVNGHKF